MLYRMQRLVFLAFVVHRALAVAPVFTTPDPNPANAANKILMSELKKGGDIVLTLAATDADTLVASLTYTMDTSAQATKDLFEIPTNTNTLKVKAGVIEGTFDYDQTGATREYPIELQVSDGTDTTSLTTKILIQDVNDNNPVFSGLEPYTGNVLQSTTGGTIVYSVTATDDDGTNTDITYALAGAPEFVINSNTGDISVAANVVLNLATTYSITVTATDNGNPPKATAITITFTIVTKPMFVNLASDTTKSIDENVGVGITVFTVTVSDEDTPTGLTVSIISQLPDDDRFEMDGNTLVTKNDLNAELHRSYTIKFRVSDGTYTTDSADLTVSVNDLNDNTPSITSVSAVTIPENKAVSSTSVVVDIAATDNDATSPNNDLTYSIISGNTGGLFGIIPATGVIYLTTAPRSMSVSQYILKVSVADKGTPSNSASIDVTVNIDPNTVNECSSNPCRNNGVCTSFVNEYSCACANTGFTGANCETNINDCTSTSCKNGGTCIDGVNTYSCNCAAGYIGTTCTQACTSNTYGIGCAQTCNCNASRLVENVGAQQCNHVTGACTCNAKWTGNDCQTDVDECTTNANICTAIANQACENTIGSYYCTCKQGYRSTTDNTCEISTSTETLNAGANEFKATVAMTLDKACVAKDLEVPSKYAALKAALESMLQSKVSPTLRVLVSNIRCGSVLFDSIIIISNTEAAKSQLASDLQDLRNGETAAVDGVNTKVTAMTVNGNTVGVTSGTSNTGAKVCQVYSTYVTCPTGQTCQYVDSTAACRTIPEEDDDNLDLILGLGLGIGLPLILIIIITAIVCFWMNNKEQYEKRRRRYVSGRDSYVMDWRDDNRRSYDRPRSDRYDYVDKRDFYGLSTDGYRF
ncbi:protocadherin Fat 4-like [Mercenaria mercenaria]|uniref:protocadherin Fat 4-like n=1 Tax=Mercenaria mercenaria TaxID=6596 RepID=UPI00234E7BF3|nr:protocadherin Fat 4-like [Mercenaria mercenaria]